MGIKTEGQVRKAYVAPQLLVKGSIAELTQTKTWGSGDALILSIISGPIADIIDSITHYS